MTQTTAPRLRTLVPLLLAALLALLAGAAPASAHAALTGSDPQQGAVVDEAPAQVSLSFSESVSTDADSLRVLAREFAVPVPTPDLLSKRLGPTDDKVVVWGAGSLVQEILANFFDPARIDFFIDRNPDKVGTELLGRPVRGPDALGHEPRTVLINSIDFASSILADIAAHYPGVAHRIVKVGDLLGGAAMRLP